MYEGDVREVRQDISEEWCVSLQLRKLRRICLSSCAFCGIIVLASGISVGRGYGGLIPGVCFGLFEL